MTLETLGNVGDFVGGVAVVVSILYLAVQIRQNTKAVRSSSYHQAAEQTWNYCLAVAQDSSLAELMARRVAGEPLTASEVLRVSAADTALVYGFENMLRLFEEGLVDPDVWNNVLHNSMPYLGDKRFRAFLAARPGPLSQRLLLAIEKLPHLYPPEAA